MHEETRNGERYRRTVDTRIGQHYPRLGSGLDRQLHSAVLARDTADRSAEGLGVESLDILDFERL